MGIVAKQSILNTLVTYVGIGFGALNTLFLFTNILSEDDYGIVTYLVATTNLLWPIMAFGLHNTVVKFYHSYTEPEIQSRFFSWILLVPIGITLLFSLGYVLLHDQIMNHYSVSNPVVKPFVWLIIVLGFLSAYFELFYAWAKVHLQSVKGNLVKELLHRVLVSTLLIFVYLEYMTPKQFIYSLLIVYGSRTLIMMLIAYKVKKIQFMLGSLPNTRSIIYYSILILIAASVAIFLLDLDKLMIENYLPISSVAIYSICVYMASVVGVPMRAMQQITNPLTAKLLVTGSKEDLDKLNKKTSLTSLIVTTWVGLLVVSNVHSIYEMVPSQYILYIEIVLLITLVKFFDASLGITNSILFNSDSYKWILFFGVGVLGAAFYLNTIFIPEYGIVGAAIATFLSYALYNLAKYIFVYIKFQIQPFSIKTILILIWSFVLYILFYYWNITVVHPMIAIVIKGALLSLSYMMFIYFTRLSPEITKTINQVFKTNKN